MRLPPAKATSKAKAPSKPMSAVVEIRAINLRERVAYLSDGRTVPITTLFDHLGEETSDTAQAVAFVAGEGRQWLSLPVSDFEPATIH